MERVTEYRVTYQGGECIKTRDKAEAELYIAQGVAVGRAAADYGIDHRGVTYSDWALTTYDKRRAVRQAAALLEDREELARAFGPSV